LIVSIAYSLSSIIKTNERPAITAHASEVKSDERNGNNREGSQGNPKKKGG